MFKKWFLFFCCAGLTANLLAQGVGINNPNPDPTAALDILSTTQGLLIPRMTDAQRNAMVNPANGLQIINTTENCLEIYFTGTGWVKVMCNCTGAPAQPANISGLANVCVNQQGVTYSISPVPGAVTYNWVVTGGGTVASGQGSASITVNFTSGPAVVSVTADNFCGNSPATTLNVTAANPSAAFTFSPGGGVIGQPVNYAATQSGLNYSWVFPSGSPATSATQNQAVTWSSGGTYSVQLAVSDNFSCVDTVTQPITVINCPPGSQTFNANGSGPTGSIQTFVVPPCVTSIVVEAWGAQGGNSSPNIGGYGAYISGTIPVVGGETLNILVGRQAVAVTCAAGGGGGSYVVRASNNTPLLIAGGGSGATCGSAGLPGQSGNNGAAGMSCGANGGTGGNGGGSATNCGSGTGGGGGFYSNGVSSGSYGNQFGYGYLQGGNGGSSQSGGATGGYGGGAGTHNNNTGGGPGGGYSGGGAPNHGNGFSGGGGGSFNSGTSQTNTTGGANSGGHGKVTISW